MTAELSVLEQVIADVGADEFQRMLVALPLAEQAQLAFRWDLIARPNQLPPPGGNWRTFLLVAGRGFGKTRTGLEAVRAEVEGGRARRVALVAPTASSARSVLVEGQSGMLAISPPWFKPIYQPALRQLTWPNGAIASIYSADEPDRLRGPEFDLALVDELCAFYDPQAVWDMLALALRIGDRPRAFICTTPRPIPLLRKLINDPSVAVTRGSTFDNRANLSASFIEGIEATYAGSRLGRQEIFAELLSDAPGALWHLEAVERDRVRHAPPLKRIVIGVDPAVSTNARSNETGIIVAGIGDCPCKGRLERHAFILEDCSGSMSPAQWATAVHGAYGRHEASRVIAERNQGGNLVEMNLRANGFSNLSLRTVHASTGKQTRAEPIAALYEMGKVHHVGALPRLEDQMCGWSPLEDATSPDRVDACVYALTDLMLGAGNAPITFSKVPLAPSRFPRVPGRDAPWRGGRFGGDR